MQTAIVSLVALGALLVVVRRVVGAIRPPKGMKGQLACPSCASGSDACGTTAPTVTTVASTSPASAGASDVQPLVLVRSKPD